MAELCRMYGVSRPTGYAWIRRYQEADHDVGAGVERSRPAAPPPAAPPRPGRRAATPPAPPGPPPRNQSDGAANLVGEIRAPSPMNSASCARHADCSLGGGGPSPSGAPAPGAFR
jgi:hypothetical protein